MSKLMIIVGSVRPGRIGLPISRWVESVVQETTDFEVDFADLAELALPFMDEPNHPVMRQYTKQHTIDWSARVEAADAFIMVMPEYNHSYSPALKNALDFLSQEWWRKPVGVAAYGGLSGGTRAVVSIEPVLAGLGLVRAGAQLEMPFAKQQIADGVFTPLEREAAVLGKLIVELTELTTALKPLQHK